MAVEIPAFLDPVLDYLSDVLPSPLYSFIVNLVSHLLAFFIALWTFLLSLRSKNPYEWDAQTILPPLISLLAAYLALTSLYRTTSWMVRASVWFVKWGTVLGVLMGGVGWYIGNGYAQGNGLLAGGNIITGVGGLMWDIINGGANNPAPRTRATRKSRTSRSQINRNKKPRVWESFQKQREWQNQENDEAGTEAADVQHIIKGAIDKVDEVFAGNSWWDMAKNIIDVKGGQNQEDTDNSRRSKKAKSNSR